ncbi:N-acetyltransferase family 8 member 3-like [Chaetodon trifascialis]|uniref:N-acetyltransferase family 8 member 3-like n=1 Tax=Chaetodon trifascialis TaxID=109706 RepID=UPI003993E79D
MQLVIRRYRPSDKDVVLTLFSTGIQEQILVRFHNAMTSPLYVTVTLALCIAGYLLCSVLGAVVFPGVWVGLVYYCIYSISCYVREKLQTDMQDIPGNYLSRPDDCYWVAEADVDGRAQIIGMVAVVGKQSGERRYGELRRMIVSPLSRRMGLGARLAHTAIDFCKERGFSEVVLETSSTRTVAVALYKKLGFRQVSYTEPTVPAWMAKLAKVTFLRMTKHL